MCPIGPMCPIGRLGTIRPVTNARMPRSMEVYNFFIDAKGHLRSGWRLAIFAVAFIILAQLMGLLLILAISLGFGKSLQEIDGSLWSIVAGHGSILISALLLGWACGALLEELP